MARLVGKQVIVTDRTTGKVVRDLNIPASAEMNFHTTLGDNTIVFYDRGTAKYNKRVHGGDVRLKSWLGFRNNIVVRCTALAMEGVYPAEGDQ